MLTWLKTTTGMMVGIIVMVLIIIGVWKFNSIKDAVLTRLYNQKTVSSEAHGDSAKVEIKAADSIHVAGQPIRDDFLRTINSPEVRSSPIATKVAEKAKAVVSNSDAENTRLRAANTQLERQVNDLQTRPDKPIPRTIPYVDILYSRSFTSNRGVPVIRAGVDYRIVSFAKAKLEGSYEPPPAYTKEEQLALKSAGIDPARPELRATVGLHLTF